MRVCELISCMSSLEPQRRRNVFSYVYVLVCVYRSGFLADSAVAAETV